jgi:hypothetical protein
MTSCTGQTGAIHWKGRVGGGPQKVTARFEELSGAFFSFERATIVLHIKANNQFA